MRCDANEHSHNDEEEQSPSLMVYYLAKEISDLHDGEGIEKPECDNPNDDNWEYNIGQEDDD